MAILFGQGIIIIFAGYFETITGNLVYAWSTVFGFLSAFFIIISIYHLRVLPFPQNDGEKTIKNTKDIFSEYFYIVKTYFKKPQITVTIFFILLYRFGEAQLVKIAPLFMLDSRSAGGLNLTTSEYGFIYGTLGVAMLTIGGIIGGFFIAKHGLKFWILWMALAMKLPDLAYVYMAHAQPTNLTLISILVAIEQLGYGFGFTAYLLYMMMISEGENKTTHYAICTGIMALGMMIPGMFSGAIQESFGYVSFFYWVMISTIPGLILIKFLSIDEKFGLNRDK